MRRRLDTALMGFAAVVLAASPARAGMASFTLPDVLHYFALANLTRMRLEAISFFLACLLGCAGVIQLVWNSLRRDFPILPRLSYGKALGVIVLWGLLFVLVLTMISGARELMTPGAWEKNGLTYRLARDASSRDAERQIMERTRAIEGLRDALVAYAAGHEHRFPPSAGRGAIPEALWDVPGLPGRRYVYVEGGHLVDGESPAPATPLAYEPEDFGSDRLVVRTDGSVHWLPAVEIERLLGRGDR